MFFCFMLSFDGMNKNKHKLNYTGPFVKTGCDSGGVLHVFLSR